MKWRWLALLITSTYVMLSRTRGQLPKEEATEEEATEEDPLKNPDKTGWVIPNDPWANLSLDEIVSVNCFLKLFL